MSTSKNRDLPVNKGVIPTGHGDDLFSRVLFALCIEKCLRTEHDVRIEKQILRAVLGHLNRLLLLNSVINRLHNIIPKKVKNYKFLYKKVKIIYKKATSNEVA